MSQHTEEELLRAIKAIEASAKEKDRALGKALAYMERIQEERRAGNFNNPQAHKNFMRAAQERTRLEDEVAKMQLHKTILQQEIEHMRANQGQRRTPQKEIVKITEKYDVKLDNNSGNDNTRKKGVNAGNVTSGAGKVAVGAVGLVGGAIRGVGGFFKGLGSKEGNNKYRDPNDRSIVNGLIFIVFFLFILVYEMLGGGYFNNIDVVRFFYAIIFLAWGWLSFPEERSSVWMVFVYTIMAPLLMSFIGSMPLIAQNLTNATIYHTIILFMFPAILYYMLFSESVRLPKIFGIARFALVASILILALGVTDAADVVNRLQQTGGDTGFDFGKAIGGFNTISLKFTENFIAPIVCGINPNCGFKTWLDHITEPFAYDATKVDELQNKNLGVYIGEIRTASSIDVTRYEPDDIIAAPVEFFVNSPIPDGLGFDLCLVANEEGEDGFKGYEGICQNNVTFDCYVNGSPMSVVYPSDKIEIRRLIATQGTYLTCLYNRPTSLGTKNVIIKAEYDFASSTYKEIRAVSVDRAETAAGSKEISKLSDYTIISTGGPVIIELSHDRYTAVDFVGDRNIDYPLNIRLKASKDTRLIQINDLLVYMPEGMELVGGRNPFCDFEKESERYNEGYLYRISEAAKNNTNKILSEDEKLGNEFPILCLMKVTDPVSFLDIGRLITYRQLNVVGTYRVQTEAKRTIRFTGTLTGTSDMGSYFGSPVCIPDEALKSITFNKGVSPLASGKYRVSDCYGQRTDTLGGLIPKDHRGIDLAAKTGEPILSAWKGEVIRAVNNEAEGKSYGKHVIIQTNINHDYYIYHLYGHLNDVKVKYGDSVGVGQTIGEVGNTGLSTGPHLHFEVRLGSNSVSNTINPFSVIDIPKPDFCKSSSLPSCSATCPSSAHKGVNLIKPSNFDEDKFREQTITAFSKRNINEDNLNELIEASITYCANNNKIDPAIVMSIIVAENSMNQNHAVFANCNNPFNIRLDSPALCRGVLDGTYAKYPTLTESVQYFCEKLAHNYIYKRNQVTPGLWAYGKECGTGYSYLDASVAQKNTWIRNIETVLVNNYERETT